MQRKPSHFGSYCQHRAARQARRPAAPPSIPAYGSVRPCRTTVRRTAVPACSSSRARQCGGVRRLNDHPPNTAPSSRSRNHGMIDVQRLIRLSLLLVGLAAAAKRPGRRIVKRSSPSTWSGQAMLAADYVAAEKAGLKPAEIIQRSEHLGQIGNRGILDHRFQGHAYLDQHRHRFHLQPRCRQAAAASAFWPLITGAKDVVIRTARKREIDNRVFKYVGVSGVDRAAYCAGRRERREPAGLQVGGFRVADGKIAHGDVSSCSRREVSRRPAPPSR